MNPEAAAGEESRSTLVLVLLSALTANKPGSDPAGSVAEVLYGGGNVMTSYSAAGGDGTAAAPKAEHLHLFFY